MVISANTHCWDLCDLGNSDDSTDYDFGEIGPAGGVVFYDNG